MQYETMNGLNVKLPSLFLTYSLHSDTTCEHEESVDHVLVEDGDCLGYRYDSDRKLEVLRIKAWLDYGRPT